MAATATNQTQNIENYGSRTREPLNNLITAINENYATELYQCPQQKKQIEQYLHYNNISVAFLSETFLQSDDIFTIKNYNVIRSDRNSNTRGGESSLTDGTVLHDYDGVLTLESDPRVNVDNASTNLSEEDWKQCEEHCKVNLLYQVTMRKCQEIDRLVRNDENVYGRTLEHKLRQAEIEAKKLKEDNNGFQMLQKLGWKEGQGLGQDGEGIVDPINNIEYQLMLTDLTYSSRLKLSGNCLVSDRISFSRYISLKLSAITPNTFTLPCSPVAH
uniref:G-patch domain-containing protein n=1 Tax=Glossina brevipalpis TaxID=37001 RepID=A0A1A9WSK3_9MUSC